jgi:hypothetical protein
MTVEIFFKGVILMSSSKPTKEPSLLQADIEKRLADEQKQRPQKPTPKKKHHLEKIIGGILLVVLVGNLLYFFISTFFG